MTEAGIDLQNPVRARIQCFPISDKVSINDAFVLRRSDYAQIGFPYRQPIENLSRLIDAFPIEDREEGDGLEAFVPALRQYLGHELSCAILLVRHWANDSEGDS
jgi:hypothetical protein